MRDGEPLRPTSMATDDAAHHNYFTTVNAIFLCSLACHAEVTLNRKLYGTKEGLQTTIEFIAGTNLTL